MKPWNPEKDYQFPGAYGGEVVMLGDRGPAVQHQRICVCYPKRIEKRGELVIGHPDLSIAKMTGRPTRRIGVRTEFPLLLLGHITHFSFSGQSLTQR